jgi:hypothetical protein
MVTHNLAYCAQNIWTQLYFFSGKCFICLKLTNANFSHIVQIAACSLVKSVPTSAQYVTLHFKIRWRKVKIDRFISQKRFCSCVYAQFAKAGKRRSKAVQLLEKSVINMFWLLFPIFNWPNITIGPGGLLPAREECNKYDLTALPIFEPAREECNKDDLTALPILEWPNSNGQTYRSVQVVCY